MGRTVVVCGLLLIYNQLMAQFLFPYHLFFFVWFHLHRVGYDIVSLFVWVTSHAMF